MSQLLQFYSFIHELRNAKMFFIKYKISAKQNQKNIIYYIFHGRLKTSQC